MLLAGSAALINASTSDEQEPPKASMP